MKNKLFSICLVVIFSVMVATPVLAASNSYSFTMAHRVVDGGKNGQFMRLSKGSASISGSHYQSLAQSGATGPNSVRYTLYNKTSGNSFGTVTSTPTTDGKRKSFSGSYSGLGGGTKYYLLIWKTYEDGRTIKGSGTVSN
ncbi:hypothetical protein [Pseudogracilibacillus sp. SO30301A]|uniref:hypothetical protein n=1 Tax=Pseudogracilibacillus sp. SO30301A TaxID=3098291 RepID=UPI00300E4C06